MTSLLSFNYHLSMKLHNLTHPCQCDPKWSSQVIQRDDITRSDSSACDTDSGSSEDDKQRDKQTQADKQTHKHTHTQSDTQAERHIANPLFTRSTGLSQAGKSKTLQLINNYSLIRLHKTRQRCLYPNDFLKRRSEKNASFE